MRRSKRAREKRAQKAIAKERMAALLEKAKDKAHEGDFSLANRYVTLARKYSMKFKIHMPRWGKRLFCKHCYRFLLPGKTSRVRVQASKIIVYCLQCKKYMRFPLKPARKPLRNPSQKRKHL